MDVLIYCLSIFIISCFILIWFVTVYNRFQNYIIRINEAEANIDSTLRKSLGGNPEAMTAGGTLLQAD